MQLTTQRTELNLIQKKDYSEVITSFREKEAVKFIGNFNTDYQIQLETYKLIF